ncbi:hypothetical protein Sphch_2680 [Sphingobium chlorophenolicum L-1]|uniref:Uncharacterized protein n=1 Tax=Sphingobium chlorophenolicum L-1 TaxID=690566 RepID=F6F0A1_SPHCR|nr:hypothetical protein [Sphingobium chlorophenolicum]AEG50325.1 hypothetical protein Sphch_2680 [Sphingobium chlorophenolicum L-1]
MNPPAKHRTMVLAQFLPWVEKGLLPALAAVAVLILFMIVDRLVDDPLVAGVIALIVPMVFLPLFRRQQLS